MTETENTSKCANILNLFSKIIAMILIGGLASLMMYISSFYNYTGQSYLMIQIENDSQIQESKSLEQIYDALDKSLSAMKLTDYIKLEKTKNQILMVPVYINFPEFIPTCYELANNAMYELKKEKEQKNQVIIYIYETPF